MAKHLKHVDDARRHRRLGAPGTEFLKLCQSYCLTQFQKLPSRIHPRNGLIMGFISIVTYVLIVGFVLFR